MADVDVLQTLQQLQQGSGAVTSPPFDQIQGPTAQPDGSERYTFGLSAPSGNSLTIPLGRWKLRLLPVSSGTARIPMRADFEANGDLRTLEIDLAQLELESHPDDLIPADLVIDPYTRLVANPALGPVRLLGPSLTLILRGPGLSDLSARFGGANGSSDARFPSARFEPPHFQIGPTGGFVGIACDEVLLDLSEDIDPTTLPDLTGAGGDGSFTGVILEELGLFIGDPEEVGTWAGMARVRNFVLRFDPLELTGVFEGELVHAVAPDDPQVEVEVTWQNDQGSRISVTEVDPTVPAPTAPETARRVRLVAKPNWASVGFQVKWTVPDGVQLDDPGRVTNPDLGWMRVPPGAHAFTVDVTDHRVDPVTATRTVIVQQPAANPATPALKVDLVASVVEPAGGSNAVQLYLPLVPTQPVSLELRTEGGVGASMSATLTLPPGWQAAEALTFSSNRQNDGGFQRHSWTLTTGTTPSEGGFGVTVTVGNESVTRRLRYTLRAAPTDGAPELDLLAYTDWRPSPGPAAALATARNGIPYEAVVWKLSSFDAPADLLGNELHDGLFADDAIELASEFEVGLATTGGLVSPNLTVNDHLFRLVGEVPTGVTGEQPPSLVLYPPGMGNAPLGVTEVKNLFAPRTSGPKDWEFYRPGGTGDAGTIRFAWKTETIQPSSVDANHEDPGVTATSLSRDQAIGFADIFRALLDHEGRVDRIGLFASASTEGTDDFNLGLSSRRLDAAKGALSSPPTGLVTAIAGLGAPHALTTQQINQASAAYRALDLSGKVTGTFWGEDHSTGTQNPFDRRVFAVISRTAPALPAIRRRTYFLVRGDAPVVPTPVPPRLPKPEQHPFRHSIFRSAHVEVELRRNDLLRFQIRLELDLERFDENDLDPAGALNPSDGIVTGFLELRRNPDPAASPRMRWELDLLADPADVDGLLALVQGGTGDALVGALGGPLIALPAMAAAAGGRTGPTGLLVALGVGTFMQQVGVFDVQTVIWKGLRLRLAHGGSNPTRFSFALDYAVKYDIDVDLTSFGIPVRMQTTTPIEVSFRNVGVDVTGAFESIELFYDPASGFALDIADPGVFRLGDSLGRILRVDRVSIGDASPLWLEVELGFALDVGVFSVDTLRIRLSLEGDTIFEPDANGVVHLDEGALDLDDLRVSINKLGVSVDVPGVIEGRGVLGIKDENGGTTVEGELELGFPSLPVLRGLDGQMKLFTSAELTALYLALGIDFAPGLPLGSTGIAVYGLHGLLGANMAPTIAEPLPWLRQPPVGVTAQSKWAPARGAWNFGAGASFGTVFDGGFAFNLVGTFLLQIPGPRFLLAANATVLSPKPGIGTNVGVLATVLLDFENDLIVAGVDFNLAIKPILELHVPVEAFFNLADASDFHIRFGQWAPESQRITLRVFDAFDAWGYLQIEGNGLDNRALDLVGTCIGAGARIEIEWGVKRLLYLEAFAEAHAGIQLKPLYFEGLVRVGGEIHAGPFSIGARGELTAKAQVDSPRFLMLRGEVCGKIDLWLTSITKCVDFELGDDDTATPAPLTPFADAVAIDRMTGLSIDPPATGATVVPLDAVFQLTFTSDITDDRAVPGITLLNDPSILRNQLSSELFYEFHLTSLDVRRVGGAAVPSVLSAWAPYTLVNAQPNPTDSQRTLRMFDWKPSAHPRQVDFGSANQSHLAQLISQLCDPIVPPRTKCTDFDEEPFGPRARWTLDQTPLRPVRVSTTGGGLGSEASSGVVTPARVIPLPGFDYPERQPVRACLHLGRPDLEKIISIKDAIGLLGLSPDRGELTDRVLTTVKGAIGTLHGEPLPFELERLTASGILVIRVPHLVSVDVTVATPHRFHGDEGEIALLDADLNLVAGPEPLGTLSPLTGAVTPTSHPDHVVRRYTSAVLDPSSIDTPATRWIIIRPPAAPETSKGREDGSLLFEVCGITRADWREFRRHHEHVRHTIELLLQQSGLIAGEPAAMAHPLLTPNAEYEVRGTLGWERFRSATDADADGDGSFAITSRRFQADPKPPADLTRYIHDHDPFDGTQPQFTSEPVVIRYASPAVDKIYAAYGKQLVIRAKADSSGHVLVQPTSQNAGVTFTPIGPLEIELHEALEAMTGSCLAGNWDGLFPQPVHQIVEPLVANTNYTVALFARPASEPAGLTLDEWKRQLDVAFDRGVGTGVDNGAVYRFDVRTSRWRDLPAELDAFRAAPVGDVIVDDPAGFAAAVAAAPTGATTRGDALADRLAIAATGGPIPIPAEPSISRLWVPDGTGYRCVGLLVDGPEPLLRRRLVGADDVQPRVTIDVSAGSNAAQPFSLGQPIPGRRVIAGERGARLFVCVEPAGTTSFAALLVGVTDAGPSLFTGPPTRHTIGIAVGSQPGVLNEKVG